MTRTFYGLRTIGVGVLVLCGISNVATVATWINGIANGTFQPNWLFALAPLVGIHLVAWIAWNYRFVRDGTRSYTALGKREIASIDDDDICAIHYRSGTIRLVDETNKGPEVNVVMGESAPNVLACYGHLFDRVELDRGVAKISQRLLR